MSSDQKHWADSAACLDKWELFDSTKPEDREKALSICHSCPVRFECLQDALTNKERNGVRGGVDETELRVVQSINSKGEAYVHAGRRIRCPYCGPYSTRFLEVVEIKRTKSILKCSKCHLTWSTRKVINKKRTNF